MAPSGWIAAAYAPVAAAMPAMACSFMVTSVEKRAWVVGWEKASRAEKVLLLL